MQDTGRAVRTAISPKTGVLWKLCAWDEVCQVPVTTILEGSQSYCAWHRSCLNAPRYAHDRGVFEEWLLSHQRSYPSTGWWGWPADRLWPVLQGVETVWAAAVQA